MLPLGVTLGFKWAESLSPTFQIAGRPVGPWRLLGLLLAFLLRGVALSHQRVQSHYSTKSLAPCALRPLHLGFWHLLHIWSARWGGCCLIVNLKNFHKSLLLLLFKVEPGVSGQLYALLGHQWVILFISVFCIASPVYHQPFPETRLCLWMSSLVSIFTYTTKASSGQALKWASWFCIPFHSWDFTSGRVGLSYAKFLPRDTEWEGSFEVIWRKTDLIWLPKPLHRCGRRPC